jgi:hypothetical protein
VNSLCTLTASDSAISEATENYRGHAENVSTKTQITWLSNARGKTASARGVVSAFRTLRDGVTRTTGLVAVLPDDAVQPTAADATALSLSMRASFAGPAAASGKVAFVLPRHRLILVFQTRDGQAEPVMCGNANVAAVALMAKLSGTTGNSFTAADSASSAVLETRTLRNGNLISVESNWRIKPTDEHFALEWDDSGTLSARVSALNDYAFSVGPKLSAPIRTCDFRRKFCRITPARITEVQVSTCGRFHGALPQTAAINLQLAREKFEFIRTAVPDPIVRHAGGSEILPECRWDGAEYIVDMPTTEVELALPEATA